MIRTASLFTVLIACLLFSCKKDPVVNIDETNITGCPVNSTCANVYTSFADVVDYKVRAGNFRVFQANNKLSIGAKSIIYIKAPMDGNTFLLDGDDIRAGKGFL